MAEQNQKQPSQPLQKIKKDFGAPQRMNSSGRYISASGSNWSSVNRKSPISKGNIKKRGDRQQQTAPSRTSSQWQKQTRSQTQVPSSRNWQWQKQTRNQSQTGSTRTWQWKQARTQSQQNQSQPTRQWRQKPKEQKITNWRERPAGDSAQSKSKPVLENWRLHGNNS
ncbi:uncharacterized protein LOC108104993 [Drosophila eugracilis]|uniref:uncharacterized protein LOC108104993 n=1 Tax=Drosophila eugracilis TaxID=29029 RepID=UPI001BD995EF|nr:uncharacterized protein LOC108104993 [Drosophila eugracilis]